MNPPDIYKRNKCVVYGCVNYTNYAEFLCTPCHTMITTGQVGAGTTFIHDMANELITARRCYDEHTRLIRLMKGLHEKNHN